MGFLEYALALSFQKNYLKTRIRVNPSFKRPTLGCGEIGIDINLPVPITSEEGTLSFLGYNFPTDSTGKARVGRLFRALVFHLTAHTVMPFFEERMISLTPKRTNLEVFAESLVNDAYVSAYISARHPDKLPDLAFANALALAKMKPVERIFNPSTRVMAALLSRMNAGTVKGLLRVEEQGALDQLGARLSLLEKDFLLSFSGKEIKINQALDDVSNYIIHTLESNGPILEAPSLPHTDQQGPSTIFSQSMKASEPEIESIFRKSLETLGGSVLPGGSTESYLRKEWDAEASQAIDTWYHQKAREEKILAKLNENEESTKFKSVEFPEEDFTQYLRARSLLSGGSRRLLDSLRVAQDALDEDPGKEMGQLDLSAVIQVIASKKPATDVFMKDEYLSRSFGWTILLDVSGSMQIKGEFARAVAICIAEATKELLMDSGSWTYFAFSDRFYVLKDASEAYSQRVRARIGGLKFGGLTYMPEAIQLGGNILTKRVDEQRFLIVISDGWPCGYPSIDVKLSKTIASLQKKGVIAIGVGVETNKMKDFFKLSSVILNARDLVRDFARIYVNASTAALEA